MADFKRAGIGCPYCGNDLYVDFDICPHCGKEVPASLLQLIQSMHGSSETPQPKQTQPQQAVNGSSEKKILTHFKELEEDSKTKIGTFERLYDEYLSRPKKYGFDDTDYAPLVNLLCSVLEVELSFAIYDKFLLYWQAIQKPYEINLKPREKCTLGTIEVLLRYAEKDGKNLMPKELKNEWETAENYFGENYKELHSYISKFQNIRNKAAHKDTISKKVFKEFFDIYQPFFEQKMPYILALKKHGDSPGYRLFVEYRKNFPNF